MSPQSRSLISQTKDRLQNYFSAEAAFRIPETERVTLVDWLSTGIVLAECQLSAGSATILGSNFYAWPESTDSGRIADVTAAWLKDLCQQTSLSLDCVIASVPRRDVSCRLLSLPGVSDYELNNLISLQIESRVQATSQALRWDILHLPVSTATAERHVLLVTVPDAVCNSIQSALKQAGAKQILLTSGDILLHKAGVLPPGTLSIEDNDSHPLTLQVIANPAKTEVLLWCHGLPVASNAAGTPANNVRQIASIIESAALRLLSGLPAGLKKNARAEELPAQISGLHAEAVAALLRASGRRTEVIYSSERNSRLVSMTAAVRTPGSRLNFLRPLATEQKRTVRNRKLLAGGVAATILGLLSFGIAGSWQSSLNRQLAQLQQDREQLQQIAERGNPVIDQWAYVSNWKTTSLNSAEEIRRLTVLLPARDRMIVTRLQLDSLMDGQEDVLRIDGLARSSEDVMNLNRSLLEQPKHYQLRPHGIEPAPAGSELPSQFRLEASLSTTSSDTTVTYSGR